MANTPIDELFNFILPPDELEKTPSRADGVEADVEEELRMLGCELIQEAGILLKLYVSMFIFHYFFYGDLLKLRAILRGLVQIMYHLLECRVFAPFMGAFMDGHNGLSHSSPSRLLHQIRSPAKSKPFRPSFWPT